MRSPIIALLDGTIDISHFIFREGTIKLHGRVTDRGHATAMASLLVGSHIMSCSTSQLHAWSTLLNRVPPYAEDESIQAERISDDLEHACAQKVDLMVLGFEFLSRSKRFVKKVTDALDFVADSRIPVFVPAGNHGKIADHPLLKHRAILPVVMTNDLGALDSRSAWGPTVALKGLRAPGYAIPVALPGAGFSSASGTSFAAALTAAGCAALFARLPSYSVSDICVAMRNCAITTHAYLKGTSIIPPAFDVWAAYQSMTYKRR